MSKKTGFDAFFDVLTSSPEFRATMTHNYKGDFDKMQENIF